MRIVECSFNDFSELCKKLDKLDPNVQKAIKRTVSDFKRRAPGWIASEVTKDYNIKKSEITPISAKAAKPKKTAGDIRIKGNIIDGAQITYEGRLLTPTHFGMKPGARPQPKTNPKTGKVKKPKPYTVTAEIKKGNRKALSSKAFLGSNGRGDIPFQRAGKKRLPLESIKTVSMPQMITNDQVSQRITERLSEGLQERLSHNLEQCVK